MTNSIDFLNQLNRKQYEIVISDNPNVLVLAGAGSGKTRVLVYRIAWLLKDKSRCSNSIMALTFTNKAAKELQSRVKQLIRISQNVWVSTFHKFAHHLLRRNSKYIDVQRDFHILDFADQLRLIKKLIKSMELDEKKYVPHRIAYYINKQKDLGIRPQKTILDNVKEKIYYEYQITCDRCHLMDFGELLLKSYELLKKKTRILKQYQDIFKDILVDEFQDTNSVQYALIELLANKNSKIMVVGDDDQSIYGWRGAQVKNMHRFVRDFHNVKTFYLEQNYRSTDNILKAANSLIINNPNRFNKILWTKKGHTEEKISLYCAADEKDEVNFVANRIANWKKEGKELKKTAVLYRSNMQSRLIEEALLHNEIYYEIYGGMKFFERQEIKNIISYLRLISNRRDDSAFERIINVPRRGIGDITLNYIKKVARNSDITLWEAINEVLKDNILKKNTRRNLISFFNLINYLEQKILNLSLHAKIKTVIQDSGLRKMYEGEKKISITCLENLDELVNSSYYFNEQKKYNNNVILGEFVSHVILDSEEKNSVSHKDRVQLMTIHAAKGLEFLRVIIVGMEEGILPNRLSLVSSKDLEEERRLAYVGITRAMENLILTYSKTRHVHGKKNKSTISRFIEEIPKIYLDTFFNENKKDHYYLEQCISKVERDAVFNCDMNVIHKKFGQGKILFVSGQKKYLFLKILFNKYGIKWISPYYTDLKVRK